MDPTAPEGQGPAFAITLGAGRGRPRGRRVVLGERPSVPALADALRSLRPERDGWWSQHVWTGDYREESRWTFAASLVADVDFTDAAGKHAAVPPDRRALFEAAVDILPASLYHPTPRGAHLVQVLDAPVADAARYRALNVAYGQRVRRVLGLAGLAATARRTEGPRPRTIRADGFHVDGAVSTDLARLLFAPNAIVDGIARAADLTVCSDETIDASTVLAWGEEDEREAEDVT